MSIAARRRRDSERQLRSRRRTACVQRVRGCATVVLAGSHVVDPEPRAGSREHGQDRHASAPAIAAEAPAASDVEPAWARLLAHAPHQRFVARRPGPAETVGGRHTLQEAVPLLITRFVAAVLPARGVCPVPILRVGRGVGAVADSTCGPPIEFTFWCPAGQDLRDMRHAQTAPAGHAAHCWWEPQTLSQRRPLLDT
eukprot:340894-Rhodomonas_salina.3